LEVASVAEETNDLEKTFAQRPPRVRFGCQRDRDVRGIGALRRGLEGATKGLIGLLNHAPLRWSHLEVEHPDILQAVELSGDVWA
jgi:hypothetical protein